MTEYAALLTELTALPTLAKSEAAAPVAEAAPVEESKPAEAPAAADAEAKPAEGEPAAEEVAEEEVEAEGEEALAKSEIPEGFIDATEVVTALQAENAALRAEMAEMGSVVKVAAGLAKSLHGTAHDQGELIKSMQAEIARLGNTGAGRRSVLVAPKAPEAPKPVQGGDLLTKALAAQAAGKIQGSDVSKIVAYTNRGMSIPEDLARQLAAF